MNDYSYEFTGDKDEGGKENDYSYEVTGDKEECGKGSRFFTMASTIKTNVMTDDTRIQDVRVNRPKEPNE